MAAVGKNRVKRTKWCPECTRKQLMWNMYQQTYVCKACDHVVPKVRKVVAIGTNGRFVPIERRMQL